jgi:hypothetical protein
MQRRCVHQSNPLLLTERYQHVVHVGIHQVVAAIAQHAVDGCSGYDVAQHLDGKTRDPDEARLPGLLDFTQRGNGLLNDQSLVAEFDIMDMEDIHVVGLQALQRLIDAPCHTLRREIKVRLAIAGALGGQHYFVPDPLERFAQSCL